MHQRVLIVEDNHSIARMLSIGIGNRYGLPVDVVTTYADAQGILAEQTNYILALVDVVLPDSINGEPIDLLIKNKVPVIVMTGLEDLKTRKDIMAKSILDYVTKSHPEDIDYIIERVGEIQRNSRIKVIVVDDSSLARSIMVKLLRIQQFIVFEAENGADALAIIEKNPDIKVVITDYNMPIMNGLDLTIQIRRKFRREAMAIIAISSETDSAISSQLLKLGASDFIHKPFIKEEFDCRINNTVRSIENLEKILDLANKDFLTGMFNRRHFFAAYEEYQKELISTPQPFSVAMIDLDNFKKINDTYGHDAGDLVLSTFADIIRKNIRGADIAARFGGEEFCIILKNAGSGDAVRILELIRSMFEKTPIVLPSKVAFQCTASIGLCSDPGKTISDMVSIADRRLYGAKLSGKNKIQITD